MQTGVAKEVANPVGLSQREIGKHRKPKVFACIPAYNQEESIKEVVECTRKQVDHVIVVDDGSFDNTAEIAEEAGALVIRHRVNMGYGAAVKSGFTMALKGRADIVVTLDADLQHNPEDIPSLLTPIRDAGAEIVVGSRIDGQGEIPAYRKAGVGFITKLMQYNGVKVKDAQSGFRAYSSKAIRTLLPNLTDPGYGMITESLAEASNNELQVAEVPVVIRYDTGTSTSKKNAAKHGAGVVYSIINYVAERRPLLTVGLPGFVSLALGLLWLVTVLDIYNRTSQFAIGTAIYSVGAIVLGVLMIFAAVILVVLARLSLRISDIKQTELYK